MQVTGVVSQIKEKITSVGPMYDIVVNGTSYGVGKFLPRGIAEGDTVSFTAEMNGRYSNVGRGTLKKVAAQPRTQAVASAPQGRELVGASPLNRGNDTQAIISKQWALNCAVSYIDLALKAGAIKLPAKDADKLKVLDGVLTDYATKLCSAVNGKTIQISLGQDDSADAEDVGSPTSEFEDDDIPF